MPADLNDARFYGILDTAYVPLEKWEEKCRALLSGGADVVQMRAKRESHAERIELLEAILPLFENTDVPLIVNDDMELTLRNPGVGLHVGQEDTEVSTARDRLGPDRILGLSTHSIEQAKEAIAFGEILNYFAVGPVFATATKPDYSPVGLELVRSVAALAPSIPFFCIGGISRLNVELVRQAGAERVVSISDILCAPDSASAVKTFQSALT